MADKDEYTVKQAAKAAGCSTQTIMRRIKNGEYAEAHKETSEFGERWLIPAHYFKAAIMTKEVKVIETTRQMTPTELKEMFRDVVREENANIEKRLTDLEAHAAERDQKLVNTMRMLMENRQQIASTSETKPWWKFW